MENEMTNDSNPALIDIYLKALLMRESTNNYEAKHKASIIEDYATGKPIRVQALGGYGILDINFEKWAEQAGLQEFSMEDEDWKDPVAQDTIARYKVQEYFNKYNSWDAVSIAWFSGEGNANELVRNGTIDYTQADSNGVNIKDYVASMNNLISEELMTMEIPMEPINLPSTVVGPPTPPVIAKQKDMQQVFAAQILDAMTKANAGGMRPSFDSQVPAGAGRFEDAVVEAQTKRGDIGKPPVEQVNKYAQTVEQAFQQYLDAVNNG